jgi:hypothetical protein
MNREVLVYGILVLLISIATIPMVESLSIEKYVTIERQEVNLSEIPDTTPPATTIILDPPEPDGNNGYYITNVTFSFIATDDESGVKETYWRYYPSTWEIYSEPILIDYGSFIIEYYSVDNAGNIEDVKSTIVRVDYRIPFTKIIRKDNYIEFKQPLHGPPKIDIFYYQIDDGPIQKYEDKIIISEHIKIIKYWSISIAGVEESHRTCYIDDTTPPETTFVITPSEPDPNSNIYIVDPWFSLERVDDLSDVVLSWWVIDGGGRHFYNGPFQLLEGQYTIEYYSIDSSGNEERHHVTTITIKDTPPAEITLSKHRLSLSKIKFSAYCEEDYGSKDYPYYVEFYLDDIFQEKVPSLRENEHWFNWTWTGQGRHTVQAIAYDYYGNYIKSETLSTSLGKTRSSFCLKSLFLKLLFLR